MFFLSTEDYYLRVSFDCNEATEGLLCEISIDYLFSSIIFIKSSGNSFSATLFYFQGLCTYLGGRGGGDNIFCLDFYFYF